MTCHCNPTYWRITSLGELPQPRDVVWFCFEYVLEKAIYMSPSLWMDPVTHTIYQLPGMPPYWIPAPMNGVPPFPPGRLAAEGDVVAGKTMLVYTTDPEPVEARYDNSLGLWLNSEREQVKYVRFWKTHRDYELDLERTLSNVIHPKLAPSFPSQMPAFKAEA